MNTLLRRASRALVLSIGLAAGAPLVAHAQEAVANRAANLRAGPDRDYPVVVVVSPGTSLEVRGCVDGYTWCDVSAGEFSGWIYAASISYPYQGQPVPVYGYGASIGLPIVVFSFGSYWDRHYRGRPFYRDRYRWEHHRPAHRPPYARPPHGQRPHGRPPHGRPPSVQPPPGRPVMRPPGALPPTGARPLPARPPVGARPPSGRPGHGGGNGARPGRGDGGGHGDRGGRGAGRPGGPRANQQVR